MSYYRHLSVLIQIMVIINDLDPFTRTVWVNIEGDNMSTDSTEVSYCIAQAVSSVLFEALLFVIGGRDTDDIVHSMSMEIKAETSTHTGIMTRKVFPTGTKIGTGPELTNIYTYSLDVERYIDRLMDDMRGELAGMLKAIAAAHFEDTDGGEGESYAVTRRSITPKP